LERPSTLQQTIPNQRSLSTLSMRSRTLLIVAAFVCAYLLSRSFSKVQHLHQLGSASVPGQGAHSVTSPSPEQHLDAADHGPSEVLSTPTEADLSEQIKDHVTADIGKITMLYGKVNPAYERALQSHKAHAEAHGYPLFILRQKLLDRLWSKPAYIMSVILEELQKPTEERLKWLL
jgi:hypothetical protein